MASLGMAQHRLGRRDEALKLLDCPCQLLQPEDEARQQLDRLRQLLQQYRWNHVESQAFLREAESLMNLPPPRQ